MQEHIISPRYGGPIIGGIQDFISMSYLFTRKWISPPIVDPDTNRQIFQGIPNLFNKKDTYALLYWGNVFRRNPAFRIEKLKA